MSQRNVALQEVATVVTIVAGVTALFYVKGKRRGGEGHDCKATDDCTPPLACRDGVCVDVKASL